MRYYFQTENGQNHPDEEGAELPSLAAACVEAVRGLGEALKARPHDFWENDCIQVHVSDQDRLQLFTLNVSVTLSAAMNGRHPEI